MHTASRAQRAGVLAPLLPNLDCIGLGLPELAGAVLHAGDEGFPTSLMFTVWLLESQVELVLQAHMCLQQQLQVQHQAQKLQCASRKASF